MGKPNHAQAYADRQYLWLTYGAAADMTGAYVDQGDLEKLLLNPTKATATKCLISQIEHWFDVGTDLGVVPRIAAATDPMIGEIADRYWIDL